MKNKKILYISLALLLIGGIGFYFYNKNKNENKPVEVIFEKINKQNIIQTVTASGKIYAEEEVKISSDVSGEIIELNIVEGQLVKKGQLLARIKPENYQTYVEQANANINNTKANLSNAQSRLKQVQAQVEQAKNSFDRTKTLYDKKIISKADFQTAETAYKSAQAEYQAAKHTIEGANYTVKGAQATAKDAQINLSKTAIYAPMDGIISLLNVKKGEKVVGTLQMSGTEMMRITKFDNMEVRVDVSESEIPKVKLNDTADVEVDAYLGKKFKGIVTQVANTSKGASNVLSTDQSTNFVVKIRILQESYNDILAENSKPFLPGMSATVDIKTKQKNNIIAVPIQAVTTKDTIINGSNITKEIIYIVKNNQAFAKEITTGIQNDTYIEVLSGVNNNEQIIAGPYNVISKKLYDGVAVTKLKEEKKKPKKENDTEEEDEK